MSNVNVHWKYLLPRCQMWYHCVKPRQIYGNLAHAVVDGIRTRMPDSTAITARCRFHSVGCTVVHAHAIKGRAVAQL